MRHKQTLEKIIFDYLQQSEIIFMALINIKMSYYAVRKGRRVGIFDTWEEILPLVDHYPGASFKKFKSIEEAEKYIQESIGPVKQLKMSLYLKKKSPVNDTPPSILIETPPSILIETPPLKNKPTLVTIKQLVKSDMNSQSNQIHRLVKKPHSIQTNEMTNKVSEIKEIVQLRKLIENSDLFKSSPHLTLPQTTLPQTSPPQTSPPQTTPPQISLPQNRPLINLHKSETTKQSKIVNVYCDGSTFNNGRKNACGGIGVAFGPNDHKNVSEPFTLEIPTNQKTEIYALIRTLKILDEMINKDKHINYDFHIYSDSEYTINCLTKWIPQWIKKNWIKKDGRPVKNSGLLKQLYELYNKHRRQYKIHHVRSHTGAQTEHALGNQLADQLATNGSRQHPNYRDQ